MTELTFKEAWDIIGGLSTPSKMPFWSWSTSAFDCITGTKLREVKGSTCSSCYACKGNYRFKNVKEAHGRRMAALSHPRYVEAFVLVLTSLYTKGKKFYTLQGKQIKENRFRWHDSGDIQSVDHLVMINDIALATPFLLHWLPTREVGIVKEYKKTRTFADNLLVRISATMVGQDYPKRPMDLPYSTVGVDTPNLAQCPAYKQGGKCLDCMNCWDFTKDVSYPLH